MIFQQIKKKKEDDLPSQEQKLISVLSSVSLLSTNRIHIKEGLFFHSLFHFNSIKNSRNSGCPSTSDGPTLCKASGIFGVVKSDSNPPYSKGVQKT